MITFEMAILQMYMHFYNTIVRKPEPKVSWILKALQHIFAPTAWNNIQQMNQW